MGVTFLGGIVRGFSGFGSALTQAPVFAILFTPPQAVATLSGLGMFASLQLQLGALPNTQWRKVLPVAFMALVTVPFGAYILVLLDPLLMRRGISAMVLVLVLVLMSGWRYPGRANLASGLGIGGLSGLINGSSGVGGPPVILYMLAGPDPAAANRANLITYYTFLNTSTFLALAFNGIVDSATLWRLALLLPAQFMSLTLGGWLFKRATDILYRRIAFAVLLIIALFGLFYH